MSDENKLPSKAVKLCHSLRFGDVPTQESPFLYPTYQMMRGTKLVSQKETQVKALKRAFGRTKASLNEVKMSKLNASTHQRAFNDARISQRFEGHQRLRAKTVIDRIRPQLQSQSGFHQLEHPKTADPYSSGSTRRRSIDIAPTLKFQEISFSPPRSHSQRSHKPLKLSVQAEGPIKPASKVTLFSNNIHPKLNADLNHLAYNPVTDQIINQSVLFNNKTSKPIQQTEKPKIVSSKLNYLRKAHMAKRLSLKQQPHQKDNKPSTLYLDAFEYQSKQIQNIVQNNAKTEGTVTDRSERILIRPGKNTNSPTKGVFLQPKLSTQVYVQKIVQGIESRFEGLTSTQKKTMMQSFLKGR